MFKTVLWLFCILAALVLLDRLGLWMESRGWIYWRRRKAQGSVLGSTVLELQKIFESDKAKHVIEAKQDSRKDLPGPGSGKR